MLATISEPRSTTLTIDGRRLHVATWGDIEAPTIMLLHGMRDHARNWDWIATRLAETHHVVAPDLRGHGDSDWVDAAAYTLAAFVLDVAEVADAMALQRFALVGHSLGGAIGLRYAAAFADRVTAFAGIECIELPIVRDERAGHRPYPARLRDWVEGERGRRSRQPRSYPDLTSAAARMREAHPTLEPATIDHLVEHAVSADADGGWRWKYDNAARLRAPDDADGKDLDACLAAIKCPALLYYGDASWIPRPPPERLSLIRDHRVVTLPGVGHWLHHEARAAFVETLFPFLSSTIERVHHA